MIIEWNTPTRQATWQCLETEPWDLAIIGGGITGAGILREASRLGLKALLVEQRDFAWGTSSRSSKLVHGGLRYLKNLQFSVTRDSVRERERLLREAPGLVEPLGFVLAAYTGTRPGKAMYGVALTIYDTLAGRWNHRSHTPESLVMLAPHLERQGLTGGVTYGDAQTDDARLVLRVLREAAADGGIALNYVAADTLLREDGHVVGVCVRDIETNQTATIRARLVVNATGAWADRLRGELGKAAALRPLRGSHLVFPAYRFPVAQAVSFPHPVDGRPVFVFPWEGTTIVGTTDVDHTADLNSEPRISQAEADYLLEAVKVRFAALELCYADMISTWAGVRPVVDSGASDPSKESRDHVVWAEDGLLTVTGGKLTTFRLLALEALRAARQFLPDMQELPRTTRAVDQPAPLSGPAAAVLNAPMRRRLLGRYGNEAAALVSQVPPGELVPILPTATLWGELRWAARTEGVRHLDDLLLRRTRLGLLLPHGAAELFPRLELICNEELGWDAERWQCELQHYTELWQQSYSPPV